MNYAERHTTMFPPGLRDLVRDIAQSKDGRLLVNGPEGYPDTVVQLAEYLGLIAVDMAGGPWGAEEVASLTDLCRYVFDFPVQQRKAPPRLPRRLVEAFARRIAA